jgi:hypothetical protein
MLFDQARRVSFLCYRRMLSSAPEALPLGPRLLHLLHLGPKPNLHPAPVAESRPVIQANAT